MIIMYDKVVYLRVKIKYLFFIFDYDDMMLV